MNRNVLKFLFIVLIAVSTAPVTEMTVDAASPRVIMSDSSGDFDNIPIELVPVVVPTAVVGGMILKSRTKRPSKGDVKYITKIDFTEKTDIPTGESITTESKASAVKRKALSKTDDSDLISSGKNILAALKESAAGGGDSNE